jgi:drug/metabolite transporter (DMT)-like permease
MKQFSVGGIPAALTAAILFGAGTPFAKVFLESIDPWMMAGILYAGSGLGLGIFRMVRGTRGARLPGSHWRWLAAAIFSGGVVGPVLLMWGLSHLPASGASLLLNAEGALTALIAWFVFRENFDRRIALGMLLIVAGAVVLSWPGAAEFGSAWPALAVIGACLAWAIDNNLTRKVALSDATLIAMWKGLSAGAVNIGLALFVGASLPSPRLIVEAAVLGFFSYGISLVLFVVALRGLGSARTGAYFSTAPFAGAVLSILILGEAVTPQLVVAAFLMACGVWLHLSEHHGHAHRHAELEHEHEHEHEHDEHHAHAHAQAIAPGVRHTHLHRHEAMNHTHEHFPDAHHRHEHARHDLEER